MGVDEVRSATCRVDYNNQQIGTCFWVDQNHLATAAHVVDASPEDVVSVRTADGYTFNARVVFRDPHLETDPGSDLALIEALEQPDE